MVIIPHTNEEVAKFLQSRSKDSLHISGNPDKNTTAETLSLSDLNSVLLYEPEEMIISVQAGITLQKLQEILASKGQWIPTLAANESSELTLGAAVAADHFNPRSLNWGALRTTILGGTFCTTSGEIFKSGSRVVKSVAGYDIHRAFCGSQGLFGVILDLTMKVQPLPEMFFRFFAPLDKREKLLQFHPTCIEEFSGKLLVEFSGYNEDITSDIAQIESDKLIIEELEDNNWNVSIKELITNRDAERNSAHNTTTDDILKKVRSVFDPEGVLI